MKTLSTIKCVACEGGVPPLTQNEITTYLQEVTGWQVSKDQKWISQRFTFQDFYHTMAFVNAIAWIANLENHRPGLEVGYNYCLVRYTTLAITGLSKNDFICAAKVDALQASRL